MILIFKLSPLFFCFMMLIVLVAIWFVMIPFIQNKRLFSWIALGVLLTLVMSSWVLYELWGGKNYHHHLAVDQITKSLSTINKTQSITARQIIDQFKELEEKINFSHYALFRLGTVYQELGLFDKAILAFQKARELNPSEEYQFQWIYTYSLQNQGKLPIHVRQAAEKLLQNDPSQAQTANLLAIDHYLNKRFHEAIAKWQYVLEVDTALSDEQKSTFQTAIRSARKQLGDEKYVDRLKINVSLDPKNINQVHPEDTLFIFVKMLEAGPPIAVIKKKAKDLPLSTEIGNDHTMFGYQMQINDKVRVVAKISKTGDPLQQEGDLMGKSDIIVVGKNEEVIKILIN